MKQDIEIAREATLKPISVIAATMGINQDLIEPYGKFIAKVPGKLIDEERVEKSNLILVTAITPTKAGIGKTTVSVGLSLGLARIGKRAVLALREPSLGPCFGQKGGAAGGGYAQVLPMDRINLHFTGDFHAITTANNMIAALLDNYIYQHQTEGFGMKQILWRRVMDVNDRSLRHIVTGLGPHVNGCPQESGFDITPASEIMAILCLASDLEDLERRINHILLGYTLEDKPFYVSDLGVGSAIAVLLKDALNPNLVQTTENTPAFIHGGPFANIAHGCNSIIATKMAMTYGDYVVTEAGFGADLGAEKFLDIKCRAANLHPSAVVLVATVRALKMHGGVELDQLTEENVEAMLKGTENLQKHVETIQAFGLPFVIAINKFAKDTKAEVDALLNWCKEHNYPVAEADGWASGGAGMTDLAKMIVEKCEEENHYAPLYDVNDSIEAKVETIARTVYGADGVEFSEEAKAKMEEYKKYGWDKLPVCMAKTQNSLSDDAKLKGRPRNFTVKVRDISISAGAGFVVIYTGNILTMPGLPKVPAAVNMGVDEDGETYGLF